MPYHQLNKPQIFLVILLLNLFCSSRETALAFALQSIPLPENAKRGKFFRLNHHRPPRMGSLVRLRGWAAGRQHSDADVASSSSTSTSRYMDEKEKKIQANQALQSMQYCVKMCFFSVVSSVLMIFIDSNIWSRFFTSSLTWVDYVEIFDSLSLLFFGGGLWRVSHLYWKSFATPNKRMGYDNLLELFVAMSWIWGIVAFNHLILCVFTAASLPIYGSEGPFSFLLERVTSRQLGAGVVGIFGVGSVVLQGICEKRATREGKAYRERNKGVQRPLRNSKKSTTRTKFDKVREAGFRAYCNQALCAGSFGVMASLEWIRWLVSIKLHVGGGNIIGHIFSVSDFITPFVITALLITLNRAFVRAAIAETVGDSDDDDGDNEIFNDLFVAQTRFYNEAAKTMKTATAFSLLPYVITPAIPYFLKVLEKLSPSLFSKMMEVFGIKM